MFPFFKKLFYFKLQVCMHVSLCVSLCVYTHMHECRYSWTPEASDQELQAFASCLLWVLGTKLSFSVRAVCAFNS